MQDFKLWEKFLDLASCESKQSFVLCLPCCKLLMKYLAAGNFSVLIFDGEDNYWLVVVKL